MKPSVIALFSCLVLASIVQADERPAADGVRSGFSLIPKSLQKNPQIECNVITEVTPAGKKIKPPTSARPTYYLLQPGYYQSLGEAPPPKNKNLSVDVLTAAMKQALAVNGYLEAEPPKTQPVLVVTFTYGDHAATNAETEEAEAMGVAESEFNAAASDRAMLESSLHMTEQQQENAPAPYVQPSWGSSGQNTAEQLVPFVLSNQRRYRQLIDRAGLVGGVKFAKELADVLKKEAQYRSAGKSTERLQELQKAEDERNRIMAASLNGSLDSTQVDPGQLTRSLQLQSGPFYHFYNRDAKTAYLIEQAFGSCYFVVASAYDGAALAKGERRLLWRTKMAVSASGVSITETLPVLIRASGDHLGKEMTELVTVVKRLPRTGKVEVGKTTVMEENAVPPTPDKNPAAKEQP